MANELLAEFTALLGGRSTTDVLNALLQRCRNLTSADSGTIYAVRRYAGSPSLVAICRQTEATVPQAEPITSSENEALAAHALKSGTVSIAADRGSLGLPVLNHAGEFVGAMTLVKHGDGAPAVFRPGETDLLDPVNPIIGDAIQRSEIMMQLGESNAELRRQNLDLARQNARIEALSLETQAALRTSVTLLAKAAELHDEDTGNHILRLDHYSEALAARLGLPAEFREEIGYSAALHDVGKMSVDAALLKKRGALTATERAEMERHTLYGYEILRQSERLHMAAEIAWCHHERWDGAGYPRGLVGEAIPLAARIVAVADVYDALRSPRPYKTARSHSVVTDWMLRNVGHFDPEVLECFARHHAEFELIYDRLVDRPPRPIS